MLDFAMLDVPFINELVSYCYSYKYKQHQVQKSCHFRFLFLSRCFLRCLSQKYNTPFLCYRGNVSLLSTLYIMGCCCTRKVNNTFVLQSLPPDLPSVLLLGLDGAGKSSIFYRLKINICLTTQPTTGYNVDIFSPVKGVFYFKN